MPYIDETKMIGKREDQGETRARPLRAQSGKDFVLDPKSNENLLKGFGKGIQSDLSIKNTILATLWGMIACRAPEWRQKTNYRQLN